MKLFNLFNWVTNLVEAFTFYSGGGSSGGGSSAPSTSTSYSTNLPEYAQPFYNELLKQTGRNVFTTDSSGAVSGVKPYVPYTGERVAGFNPEQTAVQQQVAGLTQPGGFAASQMGLGTGVGMGYTAANTGINQALNYNPNSAQTFGTTQANQYMNPYQQGVTDIALREARQQGDIQRQQGALGAIGRGTFGGARNTLMQAEQNRNLNRQLSDIQAQGSQQGYQNAQQQFNADQARQQQAQQYAASLGSQVGQTGLQAGLQGSQQLGAMSATQQTSDLQRLQAQAGSAAEKQALQQKIDDLQYQTANEQRDWQQKQLEFYSNILRGNAGALGSTQVQYTQGPAQSPLAGLGVGLQGLSLLKSLS